MQHDYFYRRHLPHIQPPNASYFVTFRLAGSLPKEVIIRLKNKQQELERELEKIEDNTEREKKLRSARTKHFKVFDEYLDKVHTGPFWLKNENVASVVSQALHFFNGKKYDLIAYTIMPNHVHMVFYVGRDSVSPRRLGESPYIVTDILHSIKKYTALQANRILRRSGQFWQHESYDHIVRNRSELTRIVTYILNNPVNAGLVEHPEEWKWSYCSEDIRLM
jgi:putative transposase